jgi:acyl dehydratase
MELTSDYAGTPLKAYTCRISARQTMNYAAAVGDANPMYFDDERQGSIIAPPLFPVAMTWPILENIADHIEAAGFPVEFLLTQVHYSEHLCIHRPVTPGGSAIIRGMIAAILPHRAGTHVVLRFDAADESGQALFTEHIGAILRGVRCVDGGRGGDALPRVPHSEQEAAVLWDDAIAIDALAPFIYDAGTNIHFPIHTSVAFAHQVGLPGIIHQGTATLARAVHAILDREAGGDSRRLLSAGCRFTGMVFPGTTITVRLTGRKLTAAGTDLFFCVLVDAQTTAIRDGHIRLKPEGEKTR